MTHNVGLVVIDSITANFRAEGSTSVMSPASKRAKSPGGGPVATMGGAEDDRTKARILSDRSADLIRTGTLLRDLARRHNCAIVVSNQVSDRFFGPDAAPMAVSQDIPSSAPSSSCRMPEEPPRRVEEVDYPTHSVLTLEHQQRFFTGWGDELPRQGGYFGQEGEMGGELREGQEKNPSLGLIWTNQIACRIAFRKAAVWAAERQHQNVPSTLRINTATTTTADKAQPSTQQPNKPVEPTSKSGQGTNTILATPDNFQDESVEWTPKKWKRWAKVVFAPWVAAEWEGRRGLEFEVWEGGVRAVRQGDGTRSGGRRDNDGQ